MHEVLDGWAWSGRVGDDARVADEPFFTIGELAREFSVTFRALRFYESRGLLAPRWHGLTRHYRQADRERLALVLRGKKLGFTLDQIARMIATAGQADTLDLNRQRCVDQINLLERKKRQIETALAELRLAYVSHADLRDQQRRTLQPT